MTENRKLIFYSTVGPERDGAWTAFSLARRAADAGLEAEIFLAGPGCRLLGRDARDQLEGRPKENLDAVLAAKVPIHYSPG